MQDKVAPVGNGKSYLRICYTNNIIGKNIPQEHPMVFAEPQSVGGHHDKQPQEEVGQIGCNRPVNVKIGQGCIQKIQPCHKHR